MSKSDTFITMTIENLIHIGQVLYGSQWQSDLARSLDIDARRIRQWLKGERPIPDWLPAELKQLLSAKIKAANDCLVLLADN